MNLIPQTEIAFKDKQTALEIMAALIEEDYVVMLSKEEELYIINYLWSPTSDRNDVVFVSREEFDSYDPCSDVEEQK